MRQRKWRLTSIFLLLALSLGACMGHFEPEVVPTQGIEPTTEPQPTLPPRVPEGRLVTLEWPSRLRTGDADLVRLTLEVDEAGNITPTAYYADHQITSQAVLIPNVYETHNVLAEARLDMAGLQVVPDDLVSQPLRPGETISFTWSVHTSEVGRFRGTVWLYLRFLPLDGSAESQKALLAQVIEIEAVNLLGLGGTAARLMGVIGVALSGLLGADDLAKGIGWLVRRTQRRV